MIVILMGVSGAGKTTIGELLALQLNWSFFDADAFHPRENIEKMSSGIPLSDEDRLPWLQAIRKHIETLVAENKSAVIACSALKSAYRKILKGDKGNVQFVYLKGDYNLIQERLENRDGHFMKADLLSTQFDTLEEPNDAMAIEINDSPEEIVRRIRASLNL